MRFSRVWVGAILVVLIVLGLFRVRFDVDVLDLLPGDEPVVQGLKLYQQHFSNSRELVLVLRAPDQEMAERIAQEIAQELRQASNAVANVLWQPPWMEQPELSAELVAALWLNQPPDVFAELHQRLAPGNLTNVLHETREQLATSMSPMEIARRSFDPYDLMNPPVAAMASVPTIGQGQNMFASADGTLRLLFVESRENLPGYEECIAWLGLIRGKVDRVLAQHASGATVRYTGRPAFVAEISQGMRKDMGGSVIGTALIIAILFWLAHRRWLPMVWLITLLGIILVGTFGLGGLILGSINVVSMGFAAILLGLAVDYAVVHYQEALAHPNYTIKQIRRAIAPSISWAAVTTISAFLALNLGGLPGLGQLGSLVAIGVALAALVMVFIYLPPLFPDRRDLPPSKTLATPPQLEPVPPRFRGAAITGTLVLLVLSLLVLVRGWPGMDSTANALRPSRSEAYAAMDDIKQLLSDNGEPLWLIIRGSSEPKIFKILQESDAILSVARTNGLISRFLLPTSLWPRPEHQDANRALAAEIVDRSELLQRTALESGFSTNALVLTRGFIDTWRLATQSTNTFWPDNSMSRWILGRFVARNGSIHVAGMIYPDPGKSVTESAATWSRQLGGLASGSSDTSVWLSGWALLGASIAERVSRNTWFVLVPMLGLVLASLWFAFHRWEEIFLSIAVLVLSAVTLLAMMKLLGWNWNLLNLMALPLVLGTGVDYSIFMQLALRRYRGNSKVAYSSVGRALILCGATAVAGFGSLGWSNNSGIASLGRVCALGVACNMLLSVYALPAWWWKLCSRRYTLSTRT